MFKPAARGKVYDLRRVNEGIIELLDYTKPINTHLDMGFISDMLADFPDRELLQFMSEGVQFKADLDMQLVFCPHLLSLANGVHSVEEELKKLVQRGWYGVFEHLPFVPCRMCSQGSVPRALEERWRRVMEAGAPRKPVFDTAGVSVVSLNDAAKGYTSVTKEQWEWAQSDSHYAEEHGIDTRMPRQRPPGSSHPWPDELKPRLADVMHDTAILKYIADKTGEPIFAFSDDMSSYFHQYSIHAAEYWKACVLYDRLDDSHAEYSYCVEYSLAMGLFMSSGVAQRGSHAIMHMFRTIMDELEDEHWGLPTELELRTAAPHCFEGAPEAMAVYAEANVRPEAVATTCDRTILQWMQYRQTQLPTSQWRQHRCYTCHCFTDDPLVVVVGVQRMVRALLAWRVVTKNCGWLMSIDEKRHIGVSLRYLGAFMYFDSGILVIPQYKVVRAMDGLRRLVQGVITFSELRKLLGLLEHFMVLNASRRNLMHGMYTKLRGDEFGPADAVRPTNMMVQQAESQHAMLGSTAGCQFYHALPKVPRPPKAARWFHLYSDAALEGATIPALGGYFHGMWWTLPIPPTMLHIPIAHLEFMAAAVNILMFVQYICPAAELLPEDCGILLHIDGLATPQVLQADSAKSIMMQIIQDKLEATPEFLLVQDMLAVCHVFGPGNCCSDAASRGYFQELARMCKQLGVKPTQLAVPVQVKLFMLEVYAHGRLVHEEDIGATMPSSWSRGAEDTASHRGCGSSRTTPLGYTPSHHSEAAARGFAEVDFDATKGYPGEGPHGRLSSAQVRRHQQALARRQPSVVPLPLKRVVPNSAGTTVQRSKKRDGHATTSTVAASASLDSCTKRSSVWSQRDFTVAEQCGALGYSTTGHQGKPSPDVKLSPTQSSALSTSTGLVMDRGYSTSRLQSKLIVILQHEKTSFAIRPKNWDLVQTYCAMHAKFDEWSRNANTRKKDEGHWSQYWLPFCDLMGTKPLRTDPEAAQPDHKYHMREVNLFVWFVLYVWQHIRPRRRDSKSAKPSSVKQVLQSIRRKHKHEGYIHCLPPLAQITKVIAGMTMWFKHEYGSEAILPHRKEPMLQSIVDTITGLQHGAVVDDATIVDMDTFMWVSFMALTAVMSVTGFRKSEISLHSGESFGLSHISRANVVWFRRPLKGQDPRAVDEEIVEPSMAQLNSLQDGDFMAIFPPPAKADQSGEKYGNFPIYIRLYKHRQSNAAWRMLQLELQYPVQQRSQRKSTPLFGPTMGQAFTHSRLDHLLHKLLQKVSEMHPTILPVQAIGRYSWHSYRIGLACALRAITLRDGSKVSDGTIQAMVRWATPQSLQAYARMGRQDYADLIDQSRRVVLDSVQAASLWQTAPHCDDDHLYEYLDKVKDLIASATDPDKDPG